MKNIFNKLISRQDRAKEGISELEDTAGGNVKTEKQRKKYYYYY